MKIFLSIIILFFIVLNLFAQVIEAPVISKESGFYTNEFNVEIFHNKGAVILYTLDGSDPTMENIDGVEWSYKKEYPTNPGDNFGELFYDTVWTYEYSAPILIKSKENKEGLFSSVSTSLFDNANWREKLQFDSKAIFKGVVLKAVAYSEGNYSELVTRNYFITSEGNFRYSLPVVCISGNPIDIYDYEKGLFVPGKSFDDWRTENPDEQVFRKVPANYVAKGDNTEFVVNFNFIKDGVSVINQNVGLRGNGNSSRVYPNKSLRLYAREDYGKKTINYPFFDDYPIQKFKRLILRNNGQDNEQALLRDAFLQDSYEDLNAERQRQIPVIVFINAEYNGIYYLIERYDKKYFDAKFNISEDKLDFLSSYEIEEGDSENFKSVMNFVENCSFETEENYNLLSEMIDIENYTDYVVAQVYSGNMDWPHSNTDFWRKKTDFNPEAPFGHDGRWRWIFKDFDVGFGQIWIDSDWYGNEYKINYLERAINNDVIPKYNIVPILIKLLDNENYRNYFINRFCDVLNTSFRAHIMSEKLHEFEMAIKPEVKEFVARWNPLNVNPYLESPQVNYPVYSFERWKINLDKMNNFALERPTFALKHLQNYFNLGKVGELALNIQDFEKGYVEVNSLSIKENTKGVYDNYPYVWIGNYFTDVPIEVRAVANEGYKFSHWEGSIYSTDSVLTLNINSETLLIPSFTNELENAEVRKEYIRLFPNPFNEYFYLFIEEYKGDFYISTLDGKIIEQRSLTSHKINLSYIPSGVYLMSFNLKGKKVIRKIMKL